MKIRYENGIDYHFDFEIDKALHQFECGVPIIDFLKYEAENFKYGKDAYFNVLNKEIEDYESRDWDYLIKANQLHPYEVSDIIEGVDTIKNAIADIQNATPPELKSTKEPQKFTGSKLIDIYDPKKVHKEFRTELKCDYDTFKAWFVDSIICDKKMSWNYSWKKGEPNKAQLMRFLFVLCSGWEPAETNTAFKINVNSNNNRAKELNPDLLQRLEKCKVD